MTSKISFLKLMKEDFKRRSWLVSLLFLIFFIGLPVALLMRIDNLMNSVQMGYTELDYVKAVYKTNVCNGNSVAMGLVVFAAFVVGISGYSYLHSRVKLDFYHSLPILRKRFFFVQYLSGILMFFVPYAVCIGLCLVIGAAHGLLTADIAVFAVQMLMFRLLEFLSCYGMVILAAVMTGKIITAILAAGVFAAYIPAAISVITGMKEMFFDTFLQEGRLSAYSALFSPMMSGIYAEGMIDVRPKWLVIGTGVLIFWIVLMTGCALCLYRIRKTETAEESVAFPRIEGVVKVLLVVPISLAAGLYVQTIVSGTRIRWFFITIVCTVVVLSALIEFIYHVNMREVFQRKRCIVIAGAAAVGIALIYRYDMMGYDAYLPEREELAQMSVYNDEVNGSFCYGQERDYVVYSAQKALNATLIDKFEPIYKVAEAGAKGQAAEGERIGVSVEYRLKSGKRELRSYTVSRELADEMYEELYQDADFVRKVYPIIGKDQSKIESITVVDVCGSTELELKAQKRQEFLEIYSKELEQVSYDEVKNHMIGKIDVMVQTEVQDGLYGNIATSYSEDGYPICDSFVKTLAFLKEEAGAKVRQEIPAEDVECIVLTDYRELEDGRTITLLDPKEIEETLKYIRCAQIDSKYEEGENISVDIEFKASGTSYGGYYFAKGEIPEFLNESVGSD